MWRLSSCTGICHNFFSKINDVKKIRAEPDLEFEGLLKRQHTMVKYYQGSLMSSLDLERVKVTGSKPRKIGLCFHIF